MALTAHHDVVRHPLADDIVAGVAAGRINATRHPQLPLTIHCYDRNVQYDRSWDPATRVARGLVLDDAGNQVTNPLPKFHNHNEPDVSVDWAAPHTVWDKLDGSLLIVACHGDDLVVATKGSFTSTQAAEGAAIIAETLGVATVDDLPRTRDAIGPFTRGWTWLFEVRYPANRIVVDYGDTRDVVLLAVRRTADGLEVLPDDPVLDDVPFVRAERLTALEGDPATAIATVRGQQSGVVAEGVVVVFDDGTRVKVKADRYVALHALFTDFSPVRIWEHVSLDRPLGELLDDVPDEIDEQVRAIVDDLTARFDAMMADYDRRAAAAVVAVAGDTVDVDGLLAAAAELRPMRSAAKRAHIRLDRDCVGLLPPGTGVSTGLLDDAGTDRIARRAATPDLAADLDRVVSAEKARIEQERAGMPQVQARLDAHLAGIDRRALFEHLDQQPDGRMVLAHLTGSGTDLQVWSDIRDDLAASGWATTTHEAADAA